MLKLINEWRRCITLLLYKKCVVKFFFKKELHKPSWQFAVYNCWYLKGQRWNMQYTYTGFTGKYTGFAFLA